MNVHGSISDRSVIDHSARVKSSQVKLSKVKLSKEKEVYEYKEKKTFSDKEKIKFSELVIMTQDQYDSLIKENGEDFTKRCVARLDLAIPNKQGTAYKCHFRAIRSWVVKQVKKDIREEKEDEVESNNISPLTARSSGVTQRFIQKMEKEEKSNLGEKQDDH